MIPSVYAQSFLNQRFDVSLIAQKLRYFLKTRAYFIFLKWGFIGATRVAKNGNKVAESLPMMRLMLHYEFVPVFLLLHVQHGGEFDTYLCLAVSGLKGVLVT